MNLICRVELRRYFEGGGVMKPLVIHLLAECLLVRGSDAHFGISRANAVYYGLLVVMVID